MSSSVVPRPSKWPFVIGDLALVTLAAVIVYRASGPLNGWESVACVVTTALGAWLCVLPFLREYQGALTLAEGENLASTVGQLRNLESIKAEIQSATGRWQAVQESSSQTVHAAQELAERMRAELGDFCAFLKKANDTEKNHLRLEVEKLRRGERDWVQTSVHILDHVFALHTAGARSGNPALSAQLAQFQSACRDSVRRLGLLGFAPELKDAFDARLHQCEEGQVAAESSSIHEVLALGYTYQGELVRRALVRTEPAAADPTG